MAALTTDVTFKGDGIKFNVRSMKFERVIDFTQFDFTAATYFEIGDLPAGFIPRAVGILELKKQDTSGGESAATFGVYLKSDSTKLAERTLGTDVGNTFALTTACTVASSTGTLSPIGVGGTLAVYANKKPTTGLVKVVIAGDMMSGEWDEGAKRDSFDPAEHIADTAVS